MPIKPSKLSGKNAQHTLEYMILLTLIMAGIIIGGPYAIRSWNAQMKGWEDSVMDSMNDPLTEAPPTLVNIPGCDFTGTWVDAGCGLSNPFPCPACGGPQQMLQLGVFNPPDCQVNNPYIDCALVAQCETAGTSATDPAANHCCTPWVTPSGCTPGNVGCPADSDCGANVGCPDNHYSRTQTCDTGYTIDECFDDGVSCRFQCGGPLTSLVDESTDPPTLPRATFCAGDNTALPGSRNYVIRDTCNPAVKCEFNCNDPYVATPAGSPDHCECPPGWLDGSTVPNYALTIGCSANQCQQGTCGPNQCEECGTNGCYCQPTCPPMNCGILPNPCGTGTINCGACPGWYATTERCDRYCMISQGLTNVADPIRGKICMSEETCGCKNCSSITNCPNGGGTELDGWFLSGDNFCYNSGQERDWDPTDRILGCYCGYPKGYRAF